jgi:uncharacterized damage-inducible protein DinB
MNRMTPESAARFAALIAEDFRQEIETTKRVFAAMPDDAAKHAYRPDPKSMTALELAWHIASVDVWYLDSIASASFEFDPSKLPAMPGTVAGILEWYGQETAKALARVGALPPEHWAQVQKFGNGEMPMVMQLTIALRHSVHHRGQLSTYLRPMGGKVPSIYGPSADEP